jgi:hypothetical protein
MEACMAFLPLCLWMKGPPFAQDLCNKPNSYVKSHEFHLLGFPVAFGNAAESISPRILRIIHTSRTSM